MPKLKCNECCELLVVVANTSSAWLLHLKDNGDLVKPSDIVRNVHNAGYQLPVWNVDTWQVTSGFL